MELTTYYLYLPLIWEQALSWCNDSGTRLNVRIPFPWLCVRVQHLHYFLSFSLRICPESVELSLCIQPMRRCMHRPPNRMLQLDRINDTKTKQEKPTNRGTKAADVLANFLAGKLQCESIEYFSAFATTMTSVRISFQSVAPSATVWPQFKC